MYELSNQKQKIPIFVQARMNSSRLPGKMTMIMKNGKTLLETVVARCRMCQMTDNVIVLTSNEPSDCEIADICRQNQVAVFQGSLENVYERYTAAIIDHGVEAFVRICGDSPLISHRLIDYSIDVFKSEKADFVSNICVRTFPSGQSVEVISSRIFTSQRHLKSRNFSNEHVTQGLYDLPGRVFSVEKIPSSSILKLSIDTKEDFDSVESMIDLHNLDCFEPDIRYIQHKRI